MSVPCKHCRIAVSYDIISSQWKDNSQTPHYCMHSPTALHEPTKSQIVIDCEEWALGQKQFTVAMDRSTSFWLESQLWVEMSMADHFWLKERMQANHPEGKKYHPTHDEQIRAAMEAEFEVCLSPRGMLQLRRGK